MKTFKSTFNVAVLAANSEIPEREQWTDTLQIQFTLSGFLCENFSQKIF